MERSSTIMGLNKFGHKLKLSEVISNYQFTNATSSAPPQTTTTTTSLNIPHYNRVKTRHKMLRKHESTLLPLLNIYIITIHLLAFQFIALVHAKSSYPSPTSALYLKHDLVRRTRSTSNNSSNANINNNEYQTNQAQTSQPLAPPAIPTSFVKLVNNITANARTQLNYNNGNYHSTRSANYSTSDSFSRFEDNQSSQKRGLFEKICIGTSNRMSGQSNKTDHYQNLAERYKNCTYVIGNLEITWLERGQGNKPLDLSFLESIREITGYLLIAYVEVEKISMPNLQIIRGRDLFKLNNARDEYAMFIIENELKSLELPNLREILAGDVGFRNNRNLCYINTINWEEIQNPNFKPKYFIDTTQYRLPECPKCHESCSDACWGPGPDMCQKFSKTNCAPQCDKGRCFGEQSRQCCHLFCAGGCTGPKQTDCLACKNFYNDGECIQECPPMRKYNPSRFLWETDPNGKYAFGATCVKECPEHLLKDNGACVRSCPPDKRSHNGECVSCGGPCPKNCQGVDVVNSKNIDQLINCTEIEGSITILDTSFNGYTELNSNNTMGARYEPMHPSRLAVFETIRNITGYLNIQAAHPDFKNLSFFSKLEIIGGRQTTDMFHSLAIIKTSLTSLNLRSLKRVKSGKIVIEENKDLCFANSNQFIKLGIAKEDDITIRNNGDDRKCWNSGLRCHEQCTRSGCWGSGPDECLSCNHYKLDDYCVSNCASTKSLGMLSFDLGNKTCSRCHSECKLGCNDRSAKNCWQCKNLMDGPYCVPECPGHKYNDNGICQECNSSCVDGCTGPSNRLGSGGCNSCGKIVIEALTPILRAHCIKAEEHCPAGYYQEYGAPVSDNHPLKMLERKPVCRRCHSRCKSCTGYGTHKDVCECAGYVANDQCEESCPRDFYADEKSRRCMKCFRECNGCFGPTEADCLNCRVYRIYKHPGGPAASPRVSGEQNNSYLTRPLGPFNCTPQCPPDKPHRIVEKSLLDPYCSEDPAPASDSVHVMFIGSTSIMSVIILAAITLCAFVYKCQIDKARTVKRLTLRLSGLDDVEPLNKSNITPNLATFSSIKETELKQGRKLGEGFGGVVYQGIWIPDGQKDPKPVAIKVLKENKNKEFLEEAYIMTSVNHPNLVKLLGVCMTCNNCMLITQLVPLGCLLDYVQKHRFETSKFLLEWGKQIASGMAYLEERRMVHRDLALRNVLLQTLSKVLISDFGLAKLLEADQSEYHSGGGRLPIKWLAPECIRERKFTHKSDVWAFGVTIWELLTFGEPPFENYDTKDVPNEIENGARLHQPPYVSAEVYKVMMSCWFYKPEDRPNFATLRDEFDKFKSQHTKYLRNPAEALANEGSNHEDYDQDSESQCDEPSPTLLNFHETVDQQQRFDEFELRHHHSESETPNGHLSTPTSRKSLGMFLDNNQHQMLEDEFSKSSQLISSSSTVLITDPNNNTNFIRNNSNSASNNRFLANSFWSVNQTTSTNSIGHKSEQPTDDNDYLIPSPCSNVAKFDKFIANHEGQISRLQPPQPSPRDPPHSAGLIGVTNYEYFYNMNRSNYANSNGPHGATNASSGHIPQSLV